jgi:hypothetical protein
LKVDISDATVADLDKQFGLATWTMINVLSDLNNTSDESGENSGAMNTDSIGKAELEGIYQMIPSAWKTACICVG